MELEIQRASDAPNQPSDEELHVWVAAALAERKPSAEIVIRVVDTEEIQALNQQYRQKDQPTNVLSFVTDLPEEVQSELLGDIVICAGVVADEAHAQAKTLQAHWMHMTVHGVLHLLGYDHIEQQEAQQMEQLERDILNKLGVADPYEIKGTHE